MDIRARIAKRPVRVPTVYTTQQLADMLPEYYMHIQTPWGLARIDSIAIAWTRRVGDKRLVFYRIKTYGIDKSFVVSSHTQWNVC